MGEWSPPDGATPQQYRGPADPSDGHDRLAKLLSEVRASLRDAPNHLLQAAGIRVEPGRLIIEGDLEVPNGKIKNDWLESPVTFAADVGNASGFGVPNAWTDLVSAAIAIPAGYSVAQYVAHAYIEASNSTGSTQYLYGRITYTLSSDPGSTYMSAQTQITLPAGFFGVCIVPLIYSTDRPAGTVFTFTAQGWASSAFASDPDHHAGIEVAGTFTR